MQILVDGDACPVKSHIERLAQSRGVPVTVFIDTSHVYASPYAQVRQVGQGRDSVDLALVNAARPGDVVITGDYGAATLAMARGCRVLGFSGLIYDESNIDRLLMERHLAQKSRRATGRCGSIKRRTGEDDQRFCRALEKLLDGQP